MEYFTQHLTNANGVTYTKIAFRSFDDLERFFVENMIGSAIVAGQSSKVIGTTLLIFDRNPTKGN